jgi:hypothetical protein
MLSPSHDTVLMEGESFNPPIELVKGVGSQCHIVMLSKIIFMILNSPRLPPSIYLMSMLLTLYRPQL